MANRTVSVSLQADIGRYVSGMTKAAAATKAVGVEAQMTQAKASRGFDLAGKGALLLGAGVVAGLGAAVAKSMEFEKAMSAVQAATGASAASMNALRDAAMKAGADTQYSATEAAGAITEMAKAGVSTADILKGGLNGALALAAAGQIDVAEAAGIASTAMTQFGLSGSEIPHVADLLAAGAGKAMGSVDDLGMALNQAGLLASSTGISIEETTGALAAFASAGLLGSDAGTSFKTMLQQLQNPSKESAELMAQLGISAYDANGNFVGLAGLAGQLQDKLGGLTQAQRDQAIAQIFGSDAARAANVLYREGAQGITEWTAKVNDAGYAQRQAAQLTDNLSGDLERLGGAFDSFLTNVGSGAQGPLRDLVQMLTGLVGVAGDVFDVISSLPAPVLAGVAAFGLWAAKGDEIGGFLGGLVQKLEPFKDAMVSGWSSTTEAISGAVDEGSGFVDTVGNIAGVAKDAAGEGLKALAKAVGPELGMAAATALITNYLSEIAEVNSHLQAAAQAGDEFRSVLAQQQGQLNATAEAAARTAVEAAGLTDALNEMNVSSRTVTEALAGNRQAYDETLAAMQEMDKQALLTSDSWNNLFGAGTRIAMDEVSGKATENADAFRELTNSTSGFLLQGQLVGNLPPALERWAEGASGAADGMDAAADAAAAAAPPVDALTQELQGAADAADAAKQQLDLFKLSLDLLTGAHVSVLQVETAFQAALADATTALQEEGGAVLDAAGHLNTHTENGRATADTLINLKDRANDYIATLIQQGATSDEANAKDAQLRQSFYDTALQMTGSKEAAQKLTDSIYGIPEERRTQIDADTHQASTNVANFQRQVDDLHGKTVTVTVVADRSASAIFTQIHNPNAAISIGGGLATGGPVRGPGGPTDDTAGLFALSDGEYVVKASSVQKYGVSLLDALNQGRLQVPGYAAGGAIQVNMDSRPLINTALGVFELMKKAYEPGSAALAFARSQVGKPYIWGGVGPAGFDCSGFMSSIVNVLRGNPPFSRVGSTATFPWPGFAPGFGGLFTIGSSPSIRGGVGHMAGTLMGVPVESTGGVGVRVGPGARGADWGYFTEHGHIGMAGGGVIGEPVFGRGLWSNRSYSFAEHGDEVVLPRGRERAGGSGGRPIIQISAADLGGLPITGTVAFDPSGMLRFVDARIGNDKYRQGVNARSS